MIDDMIEELPTVKPDTPLLDTVAADLSLLAGLETDQLVGLADELRHDLLYAVAGDRWALRRWTRRGRTHGCFASRFQHAARSNCLGCRTPDLSS